MANLDNVKHIKDKFFDTKGEIVKIEDSKGVVWKKQDTPSDRLKGTWVWNDTFPSTKGTAYNPIMNFISNGVAYQELVLNIVIGIINYFGLQYYKEGYNYDAVLMAETGEWINNEYKTLIIDTTYNELEMGNKAGAKGTKEQFMEYLEANATKVS